MPPCRAGRPKVWVMPRKRYSLNSPALPLRACGAASLSAAVDCAKAGKLKLAATAAAITIFFKKSLLCSVLVGLLSCPAVGRACASAGAGLLVEGQVEFQDIDARFAKDAELAAFRMAGDQVPDLGLWQLAQAGNARCLPLGGGHADVRIKATARGRHQI